MKDNPLRRWGRYAPYVSLAFNLVYALSHTAVGVWVYSWWFVTLGAYYAVLAGARFAVLRISRRAAADRAAEYSAEKLTGILLVVLAFCVAGINVLSVVEQRGTQYHTIVMIAIATYTFAKLSVAIVEMVKARGSASPVIKTLRNLSLANACVSVYAMQRAMLVTFPGMAAAEIRLLNIFTGTAVWILVLLFGLNLIGGKYTTMAKSKIVKANEKIAGAVTDGYKKIEQGVVDGYKKIEKGVVDGYTKLEDKFVDTYLTKEGETVEDAKARLKGNNSEKENDNE